MYVCACVCVCVCVCVIGKVRACVRECAHARLCALSYIRSCLNLPMEIVPPVDVKIITLLRKFYGCFVAKYI